MLCLSGGQKIVKTNPSTGYFDHQSIISFVVQKSRYNIVLKRVKLNYSGIGFQWSSTLYLILFFNGLLSLFIFLLLTFLQLCKILKNFIDIKPTVNFSTFLSPPKETILQLSSPHSPTLAALSTGTTYLTTSIHIRPALLRADLGPPTKRIGYKSIYDFVLVNKLCPVVRPWPLLGPHLGHLYRLSFSTLAPIQDYLLPAHFI